MMKSDRQLIECVPNFSEGRDMGVIRQITDEIERLEGVRLLNVEPGQAANRTVVTFVGEPNAVCEAAFQAVKKAGELIDMRRHEGTHPRIGATDVLPLVPVQSITLKECAELAQALARRIADELLIPCYCYEAAAILPERKNLAVCRAGGYEALNRKLTTPGKEPDFISDKLRKGGDTGELELDAASPVWRTGCTVVGARNYLIAVNFNLNTTSARLANDIALTLREKGRPMRQGGSPAGAIVYDEDGKPMMKPGKLKSTKALGWYIDEYGIAQVSMNLTDISVTPLHTAFEEVCRAARKRGMRVTGTEIIGLVPKKALVDAGKHFLEKQHRSAGVPEDDIVKIAVKSMCLNDIRPFNPREKVIEYMLEDADAAARQNLVKSSIKEFAEQISRENNCPGGSSASAYLGTLAAALGAMVANASANQAGWEDRWDEFSQWAVMGQDMMRQLLSLVDEEAKHPKRNAEEQARASLRTMHVVMQTFVVLRYMAQEGAHDNISNVGVGALAAHAAVAGAGLVVKHNASLLDDYMRAGELVAKANDIIKRANEAEHEIMEVVEKSYS